VEKIREEVTIGIVMAAHREERLTGTEGIRLDLDLQSIGIDRSDNYLTFFEFVKCCRIIGTIPGLAESIGFHQRT
jgi:hypothetical protein